METNNVKTNETDKQNLKKNNTDEITNRLTFDDFDRLGLKNFAENLFQIMEKRTNSPVTEGAYTISLNADFGNGKTTFLKMFENFIKDKKSENYSTLFINAWESDFYREPIITILSEIVNWMENEIKRNQKNENLGKDDEKQIKDPQKSKKTNDELKKKLLKVLGNIGNQAIKITTGGLVNTKEIIQPLIKDDSKKTEEYQEFLGENILKDFNQRKETIVEIKNAISEYIKDKKLLIVVDELDRTRPDYAVSFLEDMKHFFDIKDVVFLFAVNKSQLEETVKCLYGKNLNFNGYYGKFFKQEIDLPDPDKKLKRFVRNLMEKDLFKDDKISNISPNMNTQKIERELFPFFSFKMFKMTLREIEHFITVFELILDSEEINRSDFYIYQHCYPFFICLWMKEKKVFDKILNEDFGFQNLSAFFEDKQIYLLFNEDARQKSSMSSDSISLIYLLKMIISSFMKNDGSYKDQVFHDSQMNALIEKAVPKEIFGRYSKFKESLFHQDKIFEKFESYCETIVSLFGKTSFALKICRDIKKCKLINESVN